MGLNSKPSDGDFLAATRGLMTDAFFGASPVVASALGVRSGATPRGQVHITMPLPAGLSKQDISTLLGIGHFYFALTRALWSGALVRMPKRAHQLTRSVN